MTLPINTTLLNGTYRIVRYIASGGFGNTYEAEHVMLNKRVAIKEFFVKDFNNRDEATNRVTVGTQRKVALVEKLKRKFIEEAQAIAALSHPNIVRVSDVFEENGTAYYVMDYIDGLSLGDIVKHEGALSESRAIRYIRQVASALDYIHSKNRLHLDIKPSNIMVDASDNAILIDFGASKQYDEENGENTSTLVGKTPGYAPLEQMGNTVSKFSPATDIYALGATLYKVVTGQTPPEATLRASGEEDLIISSKISNEIKNAINVAMQIAKRNRPQSVSDWLIIIETKQSVNNTTPKLPESLFAKQGSKDEATILDTDKLQQRNKNRSTSSKKTKNNIKPWVSKHTNFILTTLAFIVGIGVAIVKNNNTSTNNKDGISFDPSEVIRGDGWYLKNDTIISTQTMPDALPIVSSKLEKKVLGKHLLSLQWISWDYFGNVMISKEANGKLKCVGRQESQENDDYVSLDGYIIIMSENHLIFEGIIDCYCPNIYEKTPHRVRKGIFDFTATAGRKYWRLQLMAPDEGNSVCDYVDIYMKKE